MIGMGNRLQNSEYRCVHKHFSEYWRIRGGAVKKLRKLCRKHGIAVTIKKRLSVIAQAFF